MGKEKVEQVACDHSRKYVQLTINVDRCRLRGHIKMRKKGKVVVMKIQEQERRKTMPVAASASNWSVHSFPAPYA